MAASSLEAIRGRIRVHGDRLEVEEHEKAHSMIENAIDLIEARS